MPSVRRDFGATAGLRAYYEMVLRELKKAQEKLDKSTTGAKQWDSQPSPPRSSKSMSRHRSPSLSPLASLDERFHPSASGLLIPDSLDSFLSAHPTLDARFGDMSHFNRYLCGRCGAYYNDGAIHACTSPTGITSLSFPGPSVSSATVSPIVSRWSYPPPPTPPVCPHCHAVYVLPGAPACANCQRTELPVEKRTIPVIGYRAWTVYNSWRLGIAIKPRLKSTGMVAYWAPGVNQATCSGAKHCISNAGGYAYEVAGNRTVPNPEHECGFYVLSEPDQIEKHVKLQAGHIVGAVMGWGRVVQHGEEGWRAQYAQIVALMDMKFSNENDALARSVSREYGVPILEREALERYVTEFGDSILEKPSDA